MNITKLKVWADLQKLGFEPINYRFNGKIVCVGASLRQQLTSVTGEKFHTDIITIEPHNYHYSNKRYHISGKINTPFVDKFFRYEYGQKVEFFQQVTSINEHYKAADILSTVKLMLA